MKMDNWADIILDNMRLYTGIFLEFYNHYKIVCKSLNERKKGN